MVIVGVKGDLELACPFLHLRAAAENILVPGDGGLREALLGDRAWSQGEGAAHFQLSLVAVVRGVRFAAFGPS